MNNSTNVNHQNQSNGRPSTEITIFVIIYVFIAVSIITGNALVIASYFANPKLRHGITVFFVSLALSDLCVGLVPIPYWIAALLYPELLALARFFGPLDVFSAMASIFNLVAISIERYVVVSSRRPTQQRGWLQKLNRTMICTAWCMALLISICYGFIINKPIRSLVVFLVGFAIPLVIMIILYYDIYQLVRQAQQRISRQHQTSKHRRCRCITGYEDTAKTVVIITALFVVAWTPFFVCSLMSVFAVSSLPSGKRLQRLVDFVKLMHYCNSAVNPLVYAYRNEVMRNSMVSIFRKCLDNVCCVDAAKRRRNLLLQNV